MNDKDIEQLLRELAEAKLIIRRARDASPVVRPSLKRLMPLVHEACMNLKRIPGGWQLSLGHLRRRFWRLLDIWNLLTQEEWLLSEIFPPGNDRPPRRPRRWPTLAPAVAPTLVVRAPKQAGVHTQPYP
jgi:hypothetical protein